MTHSKAYDTPLEQSDGGRRSNTDDHVHDGTDDRDPALKPFIPGKMPAVSEDVKDASCPMVNPTDGHDWPGGQTSAGEKLLSTGPPWYRSQRFILALVHFGSMLVIFLQRTSFGITIVCMVNHTATTTMSTSSSLSLDIGPIFTDDVYNVTHLQNGSYHYSGHDAQRGPSRNRWSDEITTSPSELGGRGHNLTTGNRDRYHDDVIEGEGDKSDDTCSVVIDQDEAAEDGPFDWDKDTQGMLLSAFFWSYLLCAVPGMLMVKNVSKKRVTTVSMAVTSIAVILMHGAATWSRWAVLALRILHGACTPLFILSIYGTWSKWAPPQERTSIMSFFYSGQMLANAAAFPLSGLLCQHGFLGGWPSVFYVFGMFGLVWVAGFVWLTAETPASHPRITLEERRYIETSLAEHSQDTIAPPTPWKSLMTSPAVWAICLVQFSLNWGMFLQLATLPQYMKEVMRFKINNNGLYLMLPYLATYVIGTLGGQVVNRMIRGQVMRLVWIRKLTVITANMTAACLLTALSFMDCTNSSLAVLLLTLAVGVTGLHLSCFLVNPYDIAPRHAQAILTLTNTVSTLPGVITPSMVAALTRHKTRAQWQTVFFLVSGIYVMGTLGYCILGRADLQPWAGPRNKESDLIGQKATNWVDKSDIAVEKRESSAV